MSVRTYLDHNFFHHVHEWSVGQDREVLVRSFAGHRYSLYVSGESVSELIALWGTKRSTRLQAQARFLLEIMSGRAFRYYGDLLMDELRGVRSRPFLPATQFERLKGLLEILASGGSPARIQDIVDSTRKRKEDDEQTWSEAKNVFRTRLQQELKGRSGRPPSFEEVREKWATELLDSFVTEMKNRGKLSGIAMSAADIMTRPEHYPYTIAAFRTWTALSYRHGVENRAVDRGDTFDAQQVVYLTRLDLLVSDDSEMRELCQRVHGPQVRTLTRSELLEEVTGACVSI